MKYFFVEGYLKKAPPVPEDIMKSHIAYSQKAMDDNLILMNKNRCIIIVTCKKQF